MRSSWLLGKRSTNSFKYHFSVHVQEVTLHDGVTLPAAATFSVAWKRGEKLAATRSLPVAGSVLQFDETLSLVCTMHRGKSQGYDAKEATFSLLQHDGHSRSSTRKLGKATINLSRYASIEAVSEVTQYVLLHDGVPVGDIQLTVSSRWLKVTQSHVYVPCLWHGGFEAEILPAARYGVVGGSLSFAGAGGAFPAAAQQRKGAAILRTWAMVRWAH